MFDILPSFQYEFRRVVSYIDEIQAVKGMGLDVKELLKYVDHRKTIEVEKILKDKNIECLHLMLCIMLVDNCLCSEVASKNQEMAIEIIKSFREYLKNKNSKKVFFLALAGILPLH